MTRSGVAAAAALLLLCSVRIAFGSEAPPPGPTDSRIRDVDYDPNQVYELTAFYGYEIAVFFSPDEKVERTSAGYADAWDVTEHGDFVIIKPTEQQPDTNLLIVTDRHTYSFDMRAKPPAGKHIDGSYAVDPKQVFVLRFHYPKEEQAAAEVARARADLQERIANAHSAEERARLLALAKVPQKPINRAYFYQGSGAIAPYEAWDDGVFTYFRFFAEQDLPAVFVVNEDRTESIANKHFEKDVMVVERVAHRFTLRKGKTVACIWNENPDMYTPEPTSGATERGGERLNKGH